MELEKAPETLKMRGWLWSALFVGMSLFSLADWLYGSRTETHRLLSGLGFLFLAPQAFLHPIRFSKPLWSQFKSKPRGNASIGLLAILGVALLLLGTLARWA